MQRLKINEINFLQKANDDLKREVKLTSFEGLSKYLISKFKIIKGAKHFFDEPQYNFDHSFAPIWTSN